MEVIIVTVHVHRLVLRAKNSVRQKTLSVFALIIIIIIITRDFQVPVSLCKHQFPRKRTELPISNQVSLWVKLGEAEVGRLFGTDMAHRNPYHCVYREDTPCRSCLLQSVVPFYR